jgi:hypothetical protein
VFLGLVLVGEDNYEHSIHHRIISLFGSSSISWTCLGYYGKIYEWVKSVLGVGSLESGSHGLGQGSTKADQYAEAVG